MNEMILIKDQLEKAFYGGAWHGPSVMEALNGISANKAASKPAKDVHSIWEIVLHISAWQIAVRKRLQGVPIKLTDEEDWQHVEDISEIAWSKDLINLRESMDNLIGAVEKFDGAKIDEKASGQSYSNYFMLHGLVQHNVYHAGQIVLLRKILK